MCGKTNWMIQIKELCDLATAENYERTLYQGYQLLTALHDIGLRQEEVYGPLLEYHNGLDEGFTRDLTGDILDFVVGWCAPERHLWRADGAFAEHKRKANSQKVTEGS